MLKQGMSWKTRATVTCEIQYAERGAQSLARHTRTAQRLCLQGRVTSQLPPPSACLPAGGLPWSPQAREPNKAG